MRVLISNPDTIGDVVLRQPLLAAFREAGHELALVVRPLVQPIARLIDPGARIIEFAFDPYGSHGRDGPPGLDAVVEAARDFAPDVLVSAPYTWTMLERALAEGLPHARRIGLSGGCFGEEPAESGSPFDEVVRVSRDVHELRKSEALASAVLGRAVRLADPQLRPTREIVESADAVLARLGLERGGYVAACVGHHEHTAVRNWPADRWVEALDHWARRWDRPVLLLGSAVERESSLAIAEGLESRGHSPRWWFGSDEGDTQGLVGLLEAGWCYAGRDTGPMHLSAALGKPVLAVFGGGTWPRFRPLVSPSVAVTMALPCSPCDWRCVMRRPHCVRDVPLAEVVGQIDRLESGAVEGAEARQLRPGEALLHTLCRDASETAHRYREQARRARAAQEGKQAMSDALMQRLDRLERSVQQAEEERRRSGEIAAKLDRASGELLDARGKLQQAIERGSRADQRAKELADQADSLRAALREAEQRAEQAERRADKAERLADTARRERDAARYESAQLRESLGGDDPATLRSALSDARRLAATVQAELADLRLRVEALRRERRAMEKLADQRLEALQWAEDRLGELLASRWRTLGQRIGLAMRLPWEEDARQRFVRSNGH